MNGMTEQSPLLDDAGQREQLVYGANRANGVLKRFISDNEQKLADTYVGERLPYSDYSSIDFLHDLVRETSIRCLLPT